MNNKIHLTHIKKSSLILYALLFITSGFLGGLLGSGGGILLVIALSNIIKYKSDKKTIFATSLAIILPMSAINSIIYQNSFKT